MTLLRILIIVALQTVALAYMIFDRQATLASARVVTLKTAPVDPRDMFRGDFVVLNYDISNLDPAKLDGEDKFESADTVYVTLVNKGETWEAAAIAHKPFAIQGGIPLRGKVQYANDNSLRVEYGVESYYVPEGTGHTIEDAVRKNGLTVDIAVDAQSRGAIKALRQGGQVFYVEGIL